MIIKKFVNTFDKFVKKIKQIDITVFDINVYQNVTSNTFMILNSTFKSIMLILNFAVFRSFKKFKIDTSIQSQNAERFKRIVQ